MQKVSALCPACSADGEPHLLRTEAHATEVRCERCRRHFGLRVLDLARGARQIPLDDMMSRYQMGGTDGQRLRCIAPAGMRLPAGALIACIYAGDRLVGIAHQQADRWYPIPEIHLPERRRRAAGVVLGAVLLLAGVLAVRWLGWLGEWVTAAPLPALVVGLIVLLVLLVPLFITEKPTPTLDPMLMRSPDRWGGG